MLYRSLFFGNTDNTHIQLFRYLFVGGSAFIADFSLMWFLVAIVHTHVIFAASTSFLLGLIINYCLSIVWVFNTSTYKNRWVEFAIFSGIGLLGLLINDLIIAFFQYTLASHNLFAPLIHSSDYYLIGKIVATIVVFIWNFVARKVILFSSSKRNN